MKPGWWRSLMLALCIVWVTGVPRVQAQGESILVGTIHSIVQGDPLPGSGKIRHAVAELQTKDGNIHQLQLTQSQIRQLSVGMDVSVEVVSTSSQGSMSVRSVTPIATTLSNSPLNVVDQVLPYLNVLCIFPGDPAPHPPSYFARHVKTNDLHTLRWYWEFMGVNMTGSDSVQQWATLPLVREAYLYTQPGSGAEIPKFDMLAQDCVTASQAANPTIDLARFKGINFIFSSGFGCCFWGGQIQVTDKNNIPRSFGFAMIDGNWEHIHAFWIHEFGHSLVTSHGMLLHTDDYTGDIGNVFDVMSQPFAFCPDDTEFLCSGQGLTAPQILRLGTELKRQVIQLLLFGTFEFNVDYLYEAGNGNKTAEVFLDEFRRLSCETRRGGKDNPDYKMTNAIDGVVCLYTDERQHPNVEFPDYLLTWHGNGDQVTDDIGLTGDVLEFEGVTIRVMGRTSTGFRLRITAPQRSAAQLMADVDPGVVSVYALEFPSTIVFPQTLPVTITVKPDTQLGGIAATTVLHKLLPFVVDPDGPRWRGAIPCYPGKNKYTVSATLFGIEVEPNDSDITCVPPTLQPALLYGGRTITVTPKDFPVGTVYPNVTAPLSIDNVARGNVLFVYQSAEKGWRGQLPCEVGTHQYRVAFNFLGTSLQPNEFRISCYKLYLPGVTR